MVEEQSIFKTDKRTCKIRCMGMACEMLNRIAKINEKLYECLQISDELDRDKLEALKDAETEIKSLNSYLVEKGLAEDYIMWKKK